MCLEFLLIYPYLLRPRTHVFALREHVFNYQTSYIVQWKLDDSDFDKIRTSGAIGHNSGQNGLFSPCGTPFLSSGGPKLAFRRFLEFFVLAVTFLLFELESRLLKPKRVKKLFFLAKKFFFSKILRSRRATAIFADFHGFSK